MSAVTSEPVLRPVWSRLRGAGFPHAATAVVVVIVLQWIHGIADGFVYDAAQYWAGAVALVTGQDAAVAGVLQMRGALTAAVYVPPALVSSLLGPDSAPWTVLGWNSLLAALLCVFVLPRLAELIAPDSPAAWRLWAAALGGGVMVSGFSRYPLLDVWAVALALSGFVGLAASRKWWVLALSGFALVFAVNVRPAYLAPVLIVAGVLSLTRPRYVSWAVPGALVAAVPQLVLNVAVMKTWSLVPIGTSALMNVQATYATFTTRYDTVLSPDHFPGQFYCDPGYATLQVGEEKPTSAPGVLLSVLTHLPDSIVFLSGKVAASLHWSFATPYEHPPGPGTSLMAFFIIGVSAAGLVALVWRTVTTWHERTPRMVSLATLGFWVGAVGTLVLSTPETRFALPLALVGLIGIVSAIPSRVRLGHPTFGAVVSVVIAFVLAVALFFLGKAAVTVPMPPGNLVVTALETCAALLP